MAESGRRAGPACAELGTARRPGSLGCSPSTRPWDLRAQPLDLAAPTDTPKCANIHHVKCPCQPCATRTTSHGPGRAQRPTPETPDARAPPQGPRPRVASAQIFKRLLAHLFWPPPERTEGPRTEPIFETQRLTRTEPAVCHRQRGALQTRRHVSAQLETKTRHSVGRKLKHCCSRRGTGEDGRGTPLKYG